MKLGALITQGVERVLPVNENERPLNSKDFGFMDSDAMFLQPYRTWHAKPEYAKSFVLSRLDYKVRNATALHQMGKIDEVRLDQVQADASARKEFLNDDAGIARATRVGRLAFRIECYLEKSAALLALGAVVAGAYFGGNALHDENEPNTELQPSVECKVEDWQADRPNVHQGEIDPQQLTVDINCISDDGERIAVVFTPGE